MRHQWGMLYLFLAVVLGMPLAGCGDNDNSTIDFVNCGNGTIDQGEECDDGNDSDNDDCLSTCAVAFCGDDFVNSGEEDCDGRNLGSATCVSLGRGSGSLACTGACEFNTSGCGTGATATQTPQVQATPTDTGAATPGPATPSPTPTTGGGGPTCSAGQSITVTISVTASFAALIVDTNYPGASADLPGTGTDQSVKDRVSFNVSGLNTVLDQDTDQDGVDNLIRTSAVTTDNNPAGEFATITFDCIAGQPAPSPSSFSCIVQSSSDTNGNPVSGIACSLAVTGP